jgi:hypothetical protein
MTYHTPPGNYGSPYYPPPWSPPPPKPPSNGFGTAALVLGIVGLVLSFIPFIGILAWPLVIIGLILGVVGIVRAGRGVANNRGVAIAGVACSAGGLIVCFAWVSLLGSLADSSSSTRTASAMNTSPTGSYVPLTDPAPALRTEYGVGESVDVDGLLISAGPLSKARGLKQGVLCSMVSYQNNTGEVVNYNGLFDWKLQTPDNVIEQVQVFGGDRHLSSGELAPNGKVAGNVCFDNPAMKGDYYVIHDELLGSGADIRWKTSV